MMINEYSANGYIPKTIYIACKKPITVSVKDSNITVLPAFVSDNENEKTKETVITWAKTNNHWDKEIINENPIEFIRENNPISGLKICGLDVRDEGGRAYKIVTPDNLYFDLREDVLMDTIYECGIGKGGVLLGEYVWGILGSQRRLVRYKGDLYNSLVKATERKAITTKIKNKELEIGGVYADKRGDCHVFLGFIDTYSFDRHWYNSQGEYTTQGYYTTELKNEGLWFENVDTSIDTFRISECVNSIVYRKKNNLIQKIKQFPLSEDFYKELQQAAYKIFLDDFTQYKKDAPGYCYPYYRLSHCFIRKHGDPLPNDIPKEIKDSVAFYFNLVI